MAAEGSQGIHQCRFQRVLMVVYNTQDYLVFWTCPSSSIIKKHKRIQRFGNWIYFHSRVRAGRHLFRWVREKELTSITGQPVSVYQYYYCYCYYYCCHSRLKMISEILHLILSIGFHGLGLLHTISTSFSILVSGLCNASLQFLLHLFPVISH
jgi:hypothetical protein